MVNYCLYIENNLNCGYQIFIFKVFFNSEISETILGNYWSVEKNDIVKYII